MPESDETPTDLRERATLAWIHDFAPYGVIITDTQFRIQSWNRWMTTHTGKTTEEVLNQNLLALYPDLTKRGLTSRFERALAGEVSLLSTALHGYLISMEPSLRDEAFPRMQQTARIAPLVFEKELVGVIIVIEDVTQRELQALILQRQHERDKILSWVSAHLFESEEPRRTIREVFFKVAEESDFDGYLLYLMRPENATFKLQAAGGITPEVEKSVSVLDFSSPLAKELQVSNEARACENLDAPDSPAPALAERFGFHLGVILPLVTPEGLIGVLCFGARTRATLGEGELSLLSTIGKYLAVALHKEATNLKLKAAQEKLNEYASGLEKQVNERTSRLREIIAELETFSYTLAHDLRAPIRALIGYSDVLIEDFSANISSDSKVIVGKLHRACKQLDLLTRDLLEFSKVSRQEIQLTPVNLEEVVADVLSLFSTEKGEITIRRPLHRVVAHPGLLTQCLANLIDNGLKFVKEGEAPKVVLWTEPAIESESKDVTAVDAPFSSVWQHSKSADVAKAAIVPSKSGQRSRVRIVVEDEGIGVPERAHAKIFGIFERGTSAPKYQGTGIGLAIVARAMQRMGGTYGVKSKPGAGSRFWLELPAA